MLASPDRQDALYQETVGDYGVALARLARGYEGEPLDASAAQSVRWWLPVATAVGILVQAIWWRVRKRSGRQHYSRGRLR